MLNGGLPECILEAWGCAEDELCNYPYYFIRWIFVPQPLRRQGLGTKILYEALQQAKRKGYEFVLLEAADSTLVEWYQRHGFEVRQTLDNGMVLMMLDFNVK